MSDGTPKSGHGAQRKRVTIRDVARAAGVSIGAASTALTRSKSNVVLSERTRERVIKAAQDLRYRPHAAARAMAGKRFRTIGVLATEFCMSGSYYGNIMRGIAAEATERDFHLMLKIVPTKLDMRGASIFTEQHLDGVIIPAESEDLTREALEHYDIPHVWLNTYLDEPFRCVHADELQGMGLAIDHLADLGHTRIAYLPHNVQDRNNCTKMRERGYLEAMRRRGLDPVPTYERFMDIAEHVDHYLDLNPRPTALAVYSDAMALLATNRLIERGIDIPGEISVVGNEGVVLHHFAYRKLTSVCAPVLELGRAAVRLLIHQLETDEPAKSVLLPQTLEINDSTAAPMTS